MTADCRGLVACRLHLLQWEVEMQKLGCSLIAVLAACTLGAAQDLEKKTQTKVSVQDGREITATGCLERNADGGYMLTNAANKDGALGSYLLASDDGDLKDYVGHRVEIKGKAADQGEGRIKVETKNESRVGDGDKSKTTSKAEVKGDLTGLPYLGVKSVKTIARVCP
jgi:hypothetical protein